MKRHLPVYQPAILGGLGDPRSTRTPAPQPRKPLLNDTRSTR
ncbi:hypothetical protein [Phenylobacterium sp.]|jgi:hypothetical protein